MNWIRGCALSGIEQTTDEMKLIEEWSVRGKKIFLSFNTQLTEMPEKSYIYILDILL